MANVGKTLTAWIAIILLLFVVARTQRGYAFLYYLGVILLVLLVLSNYRTITGFITALNPSSS